MRYRRQGGRGVAVLVLPTMFASCPPLPCAPRVPRSSYIVAVIGALVMDANKSEKKTSDQVRCPCCPRAV